MIDNKILETKSKNLQQKSLDYPENPERTWINCEIKMNNNYWSFQNCDDGFCKLQFNMTSKIWLLINPCDDILVSF